MALDTSIRISANGAQAVSELGKLGQSLDRVGSAAKRASSDSRSFSSETKQVSAEAAKSSQQLASAAESADRLGGALRLGAALLAVREVTQAIRALSAGVLSAQIETEKLRSGFLFLTGGDVGLAAQEIEFLRRVTRDLGLDLTSTSEQYIALAAAAKGTALEGDAVRRIFEALAKAGTVLNLSADQMAGALNAVQQMISKGRVSAEELTGQLGERLPGALQIAARALGVTTQQLFAMLEAGELAATDLLPKLAAQLEKEFGGAAQRAANGTSQALNRVANAWAEVRREFADSGPAQSLNGALEKLAKTLDNVAVGMRRAKEAGGGSLATLLGGIGGAFGYGGSSYAELLKEQERLNQGLQRMKDSWAASTLYAKQIYDTEVKLRAVQSELDRRRLRDAAAGEGTGTQGAARPGASQDAEAVQKARAALKRLVEGARSDREKLAAERASFLASYRSLLSPEELAQAEAAFAASAERIAGQRVKSVTAFKEGYDKELDLQRDAIDRQLKQGQEGFSDGLIGYQRYFEDRRRLLQQSYDVEVALLQKRLDAERQALSTNQALMDRPGIDAGSRTTINNTISQQLQNIARLEADIEKKTRDQVTNVQQLERENGRVLQGLQKQRDEIDRMLRQATGTETPESVARDVRRRYEGQLESVLQNDQDPGPLLQLIDVEVERAKFILLEQQYEQYRQALQQKEQQIQAQVDAGILTSSDGERELLRLRSESLQKLRDQSAALQDQAAKLSEVAGKEQPTEVRTANAAAEDVRFLELTMTKMEELAKSSSISAIKTAITDIVTGSKTAGDALRNMVAGFAQSMLNLLAQRLAERLVDQFTKSASSAFGGGAGGGGSWVSTAIAAIGSLFHSGGIVGEPGATTRAVPANTWRLAPRYHSGGIAGLKPNEVPAILMKGEEVLTESDPRHKKNFRGGDLNMKTDIQVVVQGDRNEGDARQAADSLKDYVHVAINEWAAKQMRPGGLLNPT